jgi:hypothetical protein
MEQRQLLLSGLPIQPPNTLLTGPSIFPLSLVTQKLCWGGAAASQALPRDWVDEIMHDLIDLCKACTINPNPKPIAALAKH